MCIPLEESMQRKRECKCKIYPRTGHEGPEGK